MLNSLLKHLADFAVFLVAARLVSLVIGVTVCYWFQNPVPGPKSISGFIRFTFPRELFTAHSVRTDVALTVLKRLTGAWGVVPVAAFISVLGPLSYKFLSSTIGAQPVVAPPMWMMVSIIAGLILIHDFAEFIVHWASHKYDILWEFHKIHHSTEFMTPLSAKRAHFMDDLARIAVIGPAMGVSVGLFAYIFKLNPLDSTFYGLDAFVIGNVLEFEDLRHSYIPLHFGWLENILMSPAQHQVHHNRLGPAKNFGSCIAIWDQLFRSFSYSLPPKSFEIGLEHHEQPNYDSIWKLYLMPFINIGHMAKRWVSGGRTPAAAAPKADTA